MMLGMIARWTPASERVTIHGKVAMSFKLGRQRTSDVVCPALMFVQFLYNRTGIVAFLGIVAT
jgi:hypothetical protein